MKAKKIKAILSLVLVIAIAFTTCITAAAASYTSWQYINGCGYYYKFRAGIGIANSRVYADANIQTTNGAFVPKSYMGACASLFVTTGSIVSSSGTVYNTVPRAGMTATTDSGATVPLVAQGLFYVACSVSSSGTILEYDEDNTPETSSMQVSSSAPYETDAASYEVTENGETYGSALCYDKFGCYPDLIDAIGINGVNGYVLKDDLFYIPSTEAEAEAYNALTTKTIPVYDLEGNVVDLFELHNSANDEVVPADPTPISPIV